MTSQLVSRHKTNVLWKVSSACICIDFMDVLIFFINISENVFVNIMIQKKQTALV